MKKNNMLKANKINCEGCDNWSDKYGCDNGIVMFAKDYDCKKEHMN